MSRTPPVNRRIFKVPNAHKTELVAPPRTRDPDTLTDRARMLRADATDAERALWASLRLMKARGYHFRRQARVGRYIADFACKGAKVIVELDGAQHGLAKNIAYDEARTVFLNARGYRVLRFANQEVFDDRDGVIEAILRELVPTRPASQDDLPMLGR
jgi:very-short-patch-repair endonuclease